MTQGNFSSYIVTANKFDQANLSAFGHLIAEPRTPVFQSSFENGINSQLWKTSVTSGTGATVDSNTQRLRIQSGTDSAGYAYKENLFPLRYGTGQGMEAMFTPLFDATPRANNQQYWGVGTVVSNALYDGFFLGYEGTDLCIVHYNRGSGTFWTSSQWTDDHLSAGDGTFEYFPYYGTPVMIKYPYLGYGDVLFFIQNPNNGQWVKFHTIQYANDNTNTQVSNPNLQFIGFNKNSGNTNNVTMYCGSVGIFLTGVRSSVGNPPWTAYNNKGSITTETNIVTLKNCTTLNGATNKGVIRLVSLNVSSSAASGNAAVFLTLNPTLGGVPSYTTINGSTADNGTTITSGDSCSSYDTAGTTITGGTRRHTITIDNPGNVNVDVRDRHIYVPPRLYFVGECFIHNIVGH